MATADVNTAAPVESANSYIIRPNFKNKYVFVCISFICIFISIRVSDPSCVMLLRSCCHIEYLCVASWCLMSDFQVSPDGREGHHQGSLAGQVAGAVSYMRLFNMFHI